MAQTVLTRERARSAWCLCLVLTAAAAMAAPAAAADDDAVFAGAVARSDALEGMSDKVGAALGRALKERGVVAILGRPAEGPLDPGRVEGLERLLADARGRYLEGDFQGAVTQSEEAISRFEDTFAFEADDDAWGVWTELMLVRALALSRLDKVKDSDRALAAIASARPPYVPDPGLAPPKFASRYALIKSKLEKSRVTLEVSSRPAGATVLIDGREVGVTPHSADDLLPGRHYVSVRLRGERHDEAVLVRQGSREVSATLGDPRGPAAERLRSELTRGGTERSIVAAADSLALETFVAVVEPGGGEVSVLLGRLRSGRLLSVTGARVKDDLSNVDDVTAALARAATAADADAWIDDGDARLLRPRFFATAPALAAEGEGEAEGDLGPVLLIGAGVGVAALVGAATLGAILLFATQPKNPGGIDVVIDASRL